jgi:hypothetical protein
MKSPIKLPNSTSGSSKDKKQCAMWFMQVEALSVEKKYGCPLGTSSSVYLFGKNKSSASSTLNSSTLN